MHAYIVKEAGYGALKNKAVKAFRNATGNTTTARTAAKRGAADAAVKKSVKDLTTKEYMKNPTLRAAATRDITKSLKRRRRYNSLTLKQIDAGKLY